MKLRYLKLIILFAGIVAISSCKKFLDINKDPDGLPDSNAPIAQLLTGAQVNLGFEGGSDLFRFSTLIMQMMSGLASQANQTWFYPDSTITEKEFIEGIQSFNKNFLTNPSFSNKKLTTEKACQIIIEIINHSWTKDGYINPKSKNLENKMPLEEAIKKGVISRVRPVVMTALMAAIGLFPAAIATGIGSETQKPLARVVIGGLATSTILTLLILPIMYALVYKFIHNRENRKLLRKTGLISKSEKLEKFDFQIQRYNKRNNCQYT